MSGSKVRFNKQQIEAAILRGVGEGLTVAAIKLQRGIIRNLNNSYGGIRLRKDGKPRRLRGASAASARRHPSPPGAPPALQTGTLMRSWQASRPKAFIGRTFAAVRIGSNLKYAPWLEYGTGQMAPRPFVRPVINAIRKEMRDDINRAVQKHLRPFRKR